jgi:adenylate cyclase, class 2
MAVIESESKAATGWCQTLPTSPFHRPFLYNSSMSAPREIEVKFLIRDVASLESRLREAGFRQKTPPTHEMNTLYDTPDGSLRARGEILRIRKYGETWKLTHKSKGISGKHKTRIEHELAIADGSTLDAIFAALGYQPRFIYEKFRSEWTDGTGDVVLDHTPIGDVAEIEGAADWIDATAHRLGVSESDYITKSYAELFFDWKKRTRSPAEHMTFNAVQAK